MMEELDDDVPNEFKGTLQLTRDDSKQSFNDNSSECKLRQNEVSNEITTNIVTNNQHDVTQTRVQTPTNIITNITQKFTPLVRKFSFNSKSSQDGDITAAKVMNQNAVALNVETPTNYFTYREGIIDKAVEDCVSNLISEDDGGLVGKYLLTEINIWDSDKERLILLMTKSVLSIKYDFIALKILEFRRILLKNLDNAVVGDLVYPPGSLVPRLTGFADGLTNAMHCCWTGSKIDPFEAFKPRDRNIRGVRLMWNRGEPLKFAVKWNPFNDDVPICTLTSHPLFLHSECNDDQRCTFNFDEFVEKLRLVIDKERLDNVTIHHRAIVLQNYIGLSSLIHNRNDFGFFKVRGKFSF